METEGLYSFTDFIIKLIRTSDDAESIEFVDLVAKLLIQYFEQE